MGVACCVHVRSALLSQQGSSSALIDLPYCLPFCVCLSSSYPRVPGVGHGAGRQLLRARHAVQPGRHDGHRGREGGARMWGGANGASHVRCVAVLQSGLYLGSLPGPSSLPRARHAGGSARHTVAVP